MAKSSYSSKNVERAHWWMAKAVDALAEADALIPSGKTRLGAYNRLYYATHHVAVALLRLVGNKADSHVKIRNQFGHEWVKRRGFPKAYGVLLHSLYTDRERADYGEYVSTFEEALERRRRSVGAFVQRAKKEIPAASTANMLKILVEENPGVRDFSFDVYCPKSYYHHTRLSVWVPKGRITDAWLRRLLASAIRTLESVRVKEAKDYVLGLNSRVNQYAEQHLLMLDFDNVSTVPYAKLSGEPGFFFRTESGFHFVGARLYNYREWQRRMRAFARVASRQHCDLSLKRRYGTLRLTESRRKPFRPVYIGRSAPR